ncbi:testis-expressed sequence 2 protein-like, partial [Scleropages formosus]
VHSATLEPQTVAQQGILIQLTGTEGEWDSLNDSNLIFPLERDEETLSSIASNSMSLVDEWGLHSPAFHVPLSSSSPGSLGDFGLSAPSFLSPHSPPRPTAPISKPFVNLVKSLSTEIESKEASLKPKPLLSLVKSISTEIARTEPEVSQSRSDSKLNLHLWRQFTQPKGRSGDSRTAPPSPSSLSPSEPKAGFFKVELEDTRRKFSEAVQEQFSMFSKIMGEESCGSPKHQRVGGPTDSAGSRGAGPGGSRLSSDSVAVETHGRNMKRLDCDPGGTPPRRLRMTTSKLCLSSEHCGKVCGRENKLEICACGDVIQVLGIGDREASHRLLGRLVPLQSAPPVPDKWLFFIAVVTYSYFVLPLPPYLSGLSLGLACGFILGLLLVLLLAPQHSNHPQRSLGILDTSMQPEMLYTGREEPVILKDEPQSECRSCCVSQGWMNEVHSYDPDTHNPSLSHSVYATLEGSCLHLAYPRSNVPRRATFNEPPHDAVFISSRHYQLANSKVFLLPPLLAHKRVWNQKYPICIVLAEGEEGADEEGTDDVMEGEPRAESQAAQPQPGHPTTLFLFARTGREKEEWFQHFLCASKMNNRCGSRSGLSPSCGSGVAQCSENSSRGSTEDISRLQMRDLAVGMREKILLDYNNYMARFTTACDPGSPLASLCHSAEGSPVDKTKFFCDHTTAHPEAQMAWINALIGRIFWDFLCEKYWADQVAHKIQKKLSKIKLPYFMNELTLTELDMGTCMPQVLSTSKPSMDRRGLWLELELVYTGSLQMTLETKMNLCKLGKESGLETDSAPESSGMTSRHRLCVLADSDEESSSAGSSDEEELPTSEPQGCLGDKGLAPNPEGHGGGRTSRKILRIVDKIAKSKYFQKATENEFIKKKIEEVSNTPLLLTVEVQELSGTLAINIPPPPTDRIWYSFCMPPRLELRVRPKLGEREVTLTHITEWIERKLQDEFQKVFVMPNMDDIYLPLMNSGLDNPPASQQLPAQPSCQSSVDSLEKPAIV